MLHGVRLHDGTASYVCRYVRTSRLQQEEAHGRAVFGKVRRCGVGEGEGRAPRLGVSERKLRAAQPVISGLVYA